MTEKHREQRRNKEAQTNIEQQLEDSAVEYLSAPIDDKKLRLAKTHKKRRPRRDMEAHKKRFQAIRCGTKNIHGRFCNPSDFEDKSVTTTETDIGAIKKITLTGIIKLKLQQIDDKEKITNAEVIALRLIELAKRGYLPAIVEVVNRVDGKVPDKHETENKGQVTLLFKPAYDELNRLSQPEQPIQPKIEAAPALPEGKPSNNPATNSALSEVFEGQFEEVKNENT